MVGQAEVVVGAEIQDVARRAAGREGNPDVGLLVGEDRPLLFIQARTLDFHELLGEVVLDALIHGILLGRSSSG